MRAMFGVLLLAGLSAGSVQAQLPSAKEREDYLAYVVAAAKAEGDLTSDAAMLGLLSLQEAIAETTGNGASDVSVSEQGLRAEADVLRAQLSGRVHAAMMDNVELLARDNRCYRGDAPEEFCARRLARLAELAGDNAYYHLVLMAMAWKSGDDAAFLRHVRAGAAATHYRSPYMDYYAALHERFKQVPDQVAPSLAFDGEVVPRAAIMAMAMSSAYAIPPFQGFSAPCREADGELRGQCLDIALMQLASAQTTVEVSIAAGVVEALGDEKARQLAGEERREAYWLVEKSHEIHTRVAEGGTAAGYDAYFENYGTQGELEAARLLMIANGIAPVPPADWTKPSPQTAPSP